IALPMSRLVGHSESGRVISAEIWAPGGGALYRGDCALSPDGTRVAMALADSNNTSHLYVRALDQLTLHLVPGTENPLGPFWSPDSRHIAFVREGKLVKANEDGSAQQTLCSLPHISGGAWTRQGWIVLGRDDGPIFRVRDTGGSPEPVTTLDSSRGEHAHEYPDLL